MTGVEGAFEMFKPFIQGLLKYSWIIAIVIVAMIIIAIISNIKKRKK